MTPLDKSGFFTPQNLNYIFKMPDVDIPEEDDDFILAAPVLAQQPIIEPEVESR